MGSQRSSTPPVAAPTLSAPILRKARPFALLGVAAALASCGTTQGPVGPAIPYPPPGPTQVQTQDGVTPPFMVGRRVVRVGLLLPFSLRPQDAAGLYSAAELALFDHGDQNTLLIPRDAGANEADAAAAARALVADGADIIIGPVLREGVLGAANEVRARNIPVIGFSSDRTVAGNGVYLLSFQLEDEVSRIVTFAASRNLRSIALLAPSNEYGRRIESALRAEASARGLTVPVVELYTRSDAEAAAAAGRLAARLQGAQAILIAESGAPLRAIGPALVQANVPRSVRLLGTSVWANDAEREPTLAGGWYVSPDPGARTGFETRYQAIFDQEPSRLSSLAYDAVALAALLSRDRGPDGFTRAGLENSEGFLGSDGIFRFRPDGSIERGLAIMEIRNGAAAAIDAAPRRFGGVTG